jgi:hypothetical protein
VLAARQHSPRLGIVVVWPAQIDAPIADVRVDPAEVPSALAAAVLAAAAPEVPHLPVPPERRGDAAPEADRVGDVVALPVAVSAAAVASEGSEETLEEDLSSGSGARRRPGWILAVSGGAIALIVAAALTFPPSQLLRLVLPPAVIPTPAPGGGVPSGGLGGLKLALPAPELPSGWLSTVTITNGAVGGTTQTVQTGKAHGRPGGQVVSSAPPRGGQGGGTGGTAPTPGHGNSGGTHGKSAQPHGNSGGTHGKSGQPHGNSGQPHGNSGGTHGKSGQPHGNSGGTHGKSGQHTPH